MSQTRAKWNELLDLLREAGERTVGEEWGVTDPDDVGEGFRNLSHLLQSALYSHQELDPHRPVFHRIVSPTRSFTGDNPDALYFEAPVSPDHEYVVRGNLAGAVYTSLTMEAGALDGKYATGISGVINDTQFDVADDGSYEVVLGGEARDANWLPVPEEGGRITTRHYYEWAEPAATSQTLHVPLSIETTDDPGPAPRWDDTTVAAALQRVINHVRGKTVDAPRPGAFRPSFVSETPNVFPDPVTPGTLAFAAADAAYSMAPYVLAPDEALVMTGRWPECRFGNVCLWNRFSQMHDYRSKPVSRNRASTTYEADGSFRMVIAHEDPGVPNWLATEGRGYGSVFWRYFLPEGPMEAPKAEVVKLADLRP